MTQTKTCKHQAAEFSHCERGFAIYKCKSCDFEVAVEEDCGSGG